MPDTTRKLGLKVAMAGLASYKAGQQQVTGANSIIKQSMMTVVGVGQQMTAGTVAIGTALGSLATGAIQLAIKGLKGLVAEIKNIVVEASTVAGMKSAFEGLTASMGQSAQSVIQAFKEATGGMTPMRDAMLQFNQAASLISPQFAVMLPDAMRSLGKVSRATGSDIKYLMNSLVLGVGRLSPMILDNLQIQVSLSEATKRATEMFGLQKDQLTKTHKQLAMANIVIEKLNRNTAHMPDITGTAAASMGSFAAVIKDTKDLIGLEFLPLFTKLSGTTNRVATQALPKLIPVAHEVAQALMSIVNWVERLIPVERIINILKNAFVALKQSFTEGMSKNIETWQNWIQLISIRGEGIARIIWDRILPAFENLSDVISNVFDNVLTPAILRAGNILNYFFRVFDKTLTGVRMLLEGRKEDAQRLFTEAWQTALATVLVVLKNVTGTVVDWGRKLVEGYATGIIEGIKTYLSAALRAVASYLKSFMAPGSPPKFLPDIGTWGAGTMNAFLEGMGNADYGLISQFTGQFRTELNKLVKGGKLDKGAFAGAFFELRGHLTKVIAQFKETGVIAEDSLDVIRKRLGMTGVGMAELIKLNLQYQAIEENILKIQEAAYELQKAQVAIQEQEEQIVKAAQRAYESGQIGAEEYEDIVKAAREQREIAEDALDAEAKVLQEEMKAQEDKGQELTEQMSLLRAQMGFHQETRDVLAEQKTLLQEINRAIGGMGKAAKDAGDAIQETLENIEIEGPNILEEFSDAWEMEGGPKLDFGELLPDVEEMKGNVEAFFNGLLNRAQQAIMQHPIVQTIGGFVEKEIMPKIAKGFFWLKDEGIPGAITKFNEFKEVGIQAYQGISTEAQKALDWFGIINTHIQEQGGWWDWLASYLIIWWEMKVKPALQPFVDWWETNGPIIEAGVLTVWEVLKSMFATIQKVWVENVWPRLKETWDILKQTLEDSGITWETIGQIVGQVAKLFGIVLATAVIVVGGIISGVITGIATALKTWAAGVRQTIQGVAMIWTGLKETLLGIWETIKAIFTGDWPAALDGLKRAAYGFKLFWRGIWNAIVGFFKSTLGGVLSFLGGFVEGMWDYFVGLYESLIGEEGIVTKTWDDIWNKITGIANAIVTWFEENIQKFVDIGKNLVGGILQGIADKWGEMKQGLLAIAGMLPRWLKDALGISSPSKIFKALGEASMEGYMQGIEDMLPKIQRLMSLQVAPAIVNPIGGGGSNVTSIDQSRRSSQSIVMPVTVIGSQEDAARFRTMMRNLLNERG